MLNTRNTNLILRWRIYPSKTLVVSREGSGIRIILDSSDCLLINQLGKYTFDLPKVRAGFKLKPNVDLRLAAANQGSGGLPYCLRVDFPILFDYHRVTA
ncbi:MAG: hypothetical protein WAZ30_10890 [Syntrophorhabdus sp.]